MPKTFAKSFKVDIAASSTDRKYLFLIERYDDRLRYKHYTLKACYDIVVGMSLCLEIGNFSERASEEAR